MAEGETSAADQQRPDTRIQNEVAWLLQSMELVDADSLQVDVQDGTVTLRGAVSHPQAVQQVRSTCD